jgi:hypothetical protein
VQPFEVGTPTPAPDQGVVPDLAPAGSAAPPAAQASAEPAARRQEPQLGDAFAAFLASERGEPIPSSLAADFAPAMTISDELVQAVTRRVLERLTDRAVRETVADIVSEVAERVVREEIARLKASLR